MKNMSQKQKILIGLFLSAIIVFGGIITLTKSMDKGFENDPVDEILAQKGELKLTLDYKEEPKDTYTIEVGDEKLTINTKDITPQIDTAKIGQITSKVEINDKEVDIKITVEDTREIKLLGSEEITIELGATKENLETILTKEVSPEETNEDDKLEFQFEYSNRFNIESKDEYEVTVIAKYANNTANRANKKIKVNIVDKTSDSAKDEIKDKDIIGKDVADKGTQKPANDSQNNKPTPKPEQKPPVNNTGGGNTNSGGNVNNKPAPQPKPQPKPPVKPAPKPQPPAKPQPKPEPKPPANNGWKVPSGLPGGAKLVENIPAEQYHRFQYNQSLPSGAAINQVSASNTYGEKSVNISGLDKNKQSFIVSYRSNGTLSYSFSVPDLSSADEAAIRSLGATFRAAYGW